MWFLLAGLARASTYVVEVDVPEGRIDPDVYDAMVEEAAGAAPIGMSPRLMARQGGSLVPLEGLLPPRVPAPVREGEPRAPRSVPIGHPGRAGGLSGKATYLSQCHGWIWYDSLGRFSTQRGSVWDTVEDFHNPEGLNHYLIAYLENAGASVYTAKERDRNPEWAFADDDGDGYSEAGTGFADGPPGFRDAAPYGYGDNPFAMGGTRTFPADGGGVATWVPDVPADGTYTVYVSWANAAGNATNAHYRITHPGGVIDRWFDQTVHGSTWQAAATLWLPAGVDGLTVELVADGGEAGRVLSADAVRVGGGVGVVERNGVTTGRPRWEEGAILSTQFNGAPSSVYDPYGDGDGSDPSSRSVWAAWEHPPYEDAVYLSWHSNAFDGTARGTVTYTYGLSGCEEGAPYPGSTDLAEAVQGALMDVITTLWDSGWQDRGTNDDCFSEVNPGLNPEMPAILVELAFHDNEEDAAALKDPRFRRDASRAMYRGIATYFAAQDGVSPAFLPEPPVDLALVHGGDGALFASWEPSADVGNPYGDVATSYRLYRSADGRSWDSGVDVAGTAATVDAAPGELVYVRVTGVNDGGESFPSPVVAARRSPDGWSPVLVVHAFDRLDAGLLDWEYVSEAGLGDLVRMDPQRMNPFDAVAAHADAVAGAGWYLDAAVDDALESLDLSAYQLIIWAAGEESTADESFSTAQQEALAAFVDGGGALWVSGSEILWDLDERGTDADRAFAAEVLGASMAADDSGTSDAAGEGPLAGLDLSFGVEDGAPYPVEWPDELGTSDEVVARYGTGGVAGALAESRFMLGYPFECIVDRGARVAVAEAVLPLLVPDYTPPDPGDPTDTEDTDDTEHPGPGPGPGPSPEETGSEETGGLPGSRGGKGCGCASGASGGWALGAAALLLARRRR